MRASRSIRAGTTSCGTFAVVGDVVVLCVRRSAYQTFHFHFFPFLSLPDTQDKPFQCTVCLKRFARTYFPSPFHVVGASSSSSSHRDLLRRHAARHDDQGRQIKRQIQKLLPGSGRVSHACKACASAKLKCEEEKPCPRCKKKGIECEIEPQRTTRDAGNSGPSQGQPENPRPDCNQLKLT